MGNRRGKGKGKGIGPGECAGNAGGKESHDFYEGTIIHEMRWDRD